MASLGHLFVLSLVKSVFLFGCLVGIIVIAVQGRNQSRENELHIDCIIALGQPTQPDACQPIIARMIDQGFFVPRETVLPSSPSTTQE